MGGENNSRLQDFLFFSPFPNSLAFRLSPPQKQQPRGESASGKIIGEKNLKKTVCPQINRRRFQKIHDRTPIQRIIISEYSFLLLPPVSHMCRLFLSIHGFSGCVGRIDALAIDQNLSRIPRRPNARFVTSPPQWGGGGGFFWKEGE